jgi:hypothetical protein
MLRHPLIKGVITDLQNNTADKWVTRDLRLISGGRIRSRFAAGSS